MATAAPANEEPTLTLSVEELRLAAEALSSDGDAFDWERFSALTALQGTQQDHEQIRHALDCGTAAQSLLFLNGAAAGQLVKDRARILDMIVVAAWQVTAASDLPNAAVAAVGGYGRGELHPQSDVDLLILLDKPASSEIEEPLSRFLTLLWDLRLEIGHSTRTIDECAEQANKDITVLTTMMESRLLLGPSSLFEEMRAAITPEKMWSSRSFFEAKLKEQHARHARHNDTGYNLEPNIKGSPGGLRDIQMIAWVTRRHFGTDKVRELVDHKFLTPGQLRLLQQGRELLWKIRFALHLLTGRKEDRLLFDHQKKIALMFGYQDASYMLGVEQLMQRYYRTVMDLSRLNEMLLQRFQEEILMNPNVAPQPLNARFQTRNGFLQIVKPEVFEEEPSALLELFLLLQQHPELKGVGADTITAVKRGLHLIDDEFRQNPQNHGLFLKIIRAPEGVTHELRRMNLYGVLGRYIPAFGRIVGRMQYDLFHTYTVDQHTLFVVSNLRRLALPRFDHEFPRCSNIMQSLQKPEIAYLGGLFHDIAKGRGGDHSELGAVDAEAFCLEHGMSRYDARLVAWLVKQHLTLSLTAQKKDISDPAVIREFAEIVGDEQHLDYLYLLTLADVRATNPELWNSWKKQLFEGLYSLTKQALRRGLANPIDKEELVEQRKKEALELLSHSSLSAEQIDDAWNIFTDEYFLRCRPDEIDSHTRLFAESTGARNRIKVDLMDQAFNGGTAVFLFTPQEDYAFAAATAVLDELGCNIADARIIPLLNNYSLTTFVVIEQSGNAIDDPRRLEQLKSRLTAALSGDTTAPLRVTRRAPRQVRMFDTNTIVTFTADSRNQRTVMELIAADRPGLLCEVGQVLRDQQLAIQTAKVLTVGERAEDVFYITDNDDQPLSDEQCKQLEEALLAALSQPGN